MADIPIDFGAAEPSSYHDGEAYGCDIFRLSDRFYVVHVANQPLYSGCEQSQLSTVAGLLNIKAKNNLSEKCYDKMSQYLPLTPRLQRLYASPATVECMTWHASHHMKQGSMHHPSDAEARRHFDCAHPNFAMEPRNVRLGLCVDEFVPHRQYDKMNSCWSVILTPYNIPPEMCMKSEFMFLTLVIPGLSNPKRLIDVYMQPLIEELL
ncbi:UNVERIFIED_CONTAM: hypothetical protein Sradi_2871000 [Sesamum radiatum]|uniref:Uncharacterized protein n=1 Tax=Sesamum radiatum TaxID=300843 RepID=A0AAW2RX37_SESRA